MPLIVYTPPAGGPHGTAIEVRAGETLLVFTDGIPAFCEVDHVAAVTTAIAAQIPGATVSTPAAAQ